MSRIMYSSLDDIEKCSFKLLDLKEIDKYSMEKCLQIKNWNLDFALP